MQSDKKRAKTLNINQWFCPSLNWCLQPDLPTHTGPLNTPAVHQLAMRLTCPMEVRNLPHNSVERYLNFGNFRSRIWWHVKLKLIIYFCKRANLLLLTFALRLLITLITLHSSLKWFTSNWGILIEDSCRNILLSEVNITLLIFFNG